MSIATFAGPFFEDSPLLDVEAVRVYALSKHRSAWHGTRSNKYVKSAVLFETLDLCMRAADEMRVQGTYFIIEQVPAVRLWTTQTSFVLTSWWEDEPFSRVGIDAKEDWARAVLHPDVQMGCVMSLFRSQPTETDSGWVGPDVEWASQLAGKAGHDVEMDGEDGSPLRSYLSHIDSGSLYFKEQECRFRPDSVVRLAEIFDDNVQGSNSEGRASIAEARRLQAEQDHAFWDLFLDPTTGQMMMRGPKKA